MNGDIKNTNNIPAKIGLSAEDYYGLYNNTDIDEFNEAYKGIVTNYTL